MVCVYNKTRIARIKVVYKSGKVKSRTILNLVTLVTWARYTMMIKVILNKVGMIKGWLSDAMIWWLGTWELGAVIEHCERVERMEIGVGTGYNNFSLCLSNWGRKNLVELSKTIHLCSINNQSRIHHINSSDQRSSMNPSFYYWNIQNTELSSQTLFR